MGDINKFVESMLTLNHTANESPLKTALRDNSQTNTPLNSSVKSKKVNISKGVVGTPENDIDLDFEHATETTSLKTNDEVSISTGDNYLTLTGTLKRGKKAGQNVDVKVNITQEQLRELETIRAKGIPARKYCQLNVSNGPHVLIWSLFISPIVFLSAFIYCFYLGTWHNILALYTEEKPFFCRILSAPIIILAYPLLIILATFGVGTYAAIGQISWNWHLWLSEVQDLEKGFFAGLCGFLGLEACSPYTEVVVITGPANHEP